MRSAFLFALVFSAALAAVPRAASADSRGATRKEFTQLWQQRLETYKLQEQQTAALRKSTFEALATKTPSADPADPRVKDWADAVEADERLKGRGMMLIQFLNYMQPKPSIGVTEAWFQSQMDEIKGKAADADKRTAHINEVTSAKGSTFKDYFVAIESAGAKRGEVLGNADELMLLIQNFDSYAGEFARADERDREQRQRIGAALSAMGQALRANQGWNMQCNTMGMITSCSGH